MCCDGYNYARFFLASFCFFREIKLRKNAPGVVSMWLMWTMKEG